jgi:hypothetical protein
VKLSQRNSSNKKDEISHGIQGCQRSKFSAFGAFRGYFCEIAGCHQFRCLLFIDSTVYQGLSLNMAVQAVRKNLYPNLNLPVRRFILVVAGRRVGCPKGGRS